MASSHKNAGGFAPQNSSKYVERKLELKVSTFYCKLNSIEEAKIVRNRYRTEKDYAIFAVAPRRGAWIEILSGAVTTVFRAGRTPQGCMD